MKIEASKTPAFLVNLPKLKSNIQLAGRMQASKHIQFKGILTHAGHSYHCRNREEIIPNHSCLTAALFPEYHVVEGNRIVDEWRPMRRW